MGGETEEKISGWTVDTLRASIEDQFKAIYRLLDERELATTKASDLASVVQQTAMRTALEAAEKAVTTALISAEKAVTKAEIAADKRFENMNEFRQQLNDQAQTFMPRSEAIVLNNALDNKISAHIKAADENIASIRSRLDTTSGNSTGTEAERIDSDRTRAEKNRSQNLALYAMGTVIAIIGILVTVWIAVNARI
jgi:predicted DNA-binding protein (UPF0251 family)